MGSEWASNGSGAKELRREAERARWFGVREGDRKGAGVGGRREEEGWR